MKNCRRCGFKKWLKPGEHERWTVIEGAKVRQFRCGKCNELQADEKPFEGQKPKVLYLDIETALMDVALFNLRVYSKYIRPDWVVTHSFIICWAAAWLGEDEFLPVMSDRVREDEARTRRDKRCLEWLWELMESADYVVGHNSDQFDIKKLHYRFTANGMGLPYKYKQIDTLKLARKYYAAESNKLDEWIKVFGGKLKHDMNDEDWMDVLKTGNHETLQKMDNYCRNDVRSGAMVFQKFREEIEGRGDKIFK